MSLCKDLGITHTALAELMKDSYPKMSKMAVSVAERSDETGVQYTSAAKKTAYILSGRVKPDTQRLHPARTTVWFTESQMKFLQQRENIGDYIRSLVDVEMKKAASDAATSKTAEK